MEIRFFRNIVAFFLLGFGTLCTLQASQDNWRIVNYSLEDGLSQISVNNIFQDSRGFLWIGTQDGLNRFDGYNFEIYRHQPSDPYSLSNSTIQSVIEDSDGNIWVGTEDGLNKFDRKKNIFEVYRHEPGNPASLSDNNIYYVYQDRAGKIWLKTEEGIDMFDPDTGVFTHYSHYNDVFTFITGPNYFSIFEDSGGRLWVGSKDGLLFFDRTGEIFRRFHHEPDDPESLSNDKIRCIFETSNGYLLIGTANGLNVFDRTKEVFYHFYPEEAGGIPFRTNVINEIYEDSNGIVWIATDRGLFTFLPENGRFDSFGGSSLAMPFNDMEVLSVFEDLSHNLWIGTLGGLYMIDSKNKFTTYRIHDYMPEAPASAMFIASVYEANEEELWLGTWGAGLFMLNRNTGEITHYSNSSVNDSRRISNDFVHVIFADSRGRIILGTRDGLDIFRGYRRGFVPLCPAADNSDCVVFNSNRIYSIFEDSAEVLWIAARYGLHSFSNGKLTSYYHRPGDSTSISSSHVYDILECRDGIIWLATAEGLNSFDPETGEFLNYGKDPEMGRFSLSNNELTCLHEDSKGNLWIGTVAGFNRFFPATGSFMVFSEMEGLPNNLIYSILEDDNGFLWLSTNRGLARFDPANFEITAYDITDGLQSYEFNLGASFKSETGELFFGGVEGVNAFYPDSMQINKSVPPLAVTSFEINSKEGTTIIAVEDRDEIILQPHENSFSIEFASLDFTRPGGNRYAYKMEGLHENWVYSGSRRIANFSSIPSGSYVFRIRGSNNDDIWNEEGISLKIIVLTPWYKSVYAYIFYTAVLLMFIYLIFLISTRQLRTANQILRDKNLVSQEISRQKEELSLKNRNITDSINYARRIQMAMMPPLKHFRYLFPDSFVYYRPKDIVSGDFYWINQRNNKVFFAVIDCTGHGVPGAFMSIIGYELLRNIINIRGIEKPSEILNTLNENFSGIFNPAGEKDFSFRDGMDIGFCVIDKKNSILEFAGAFSPMYLIRDNSIIEIKGNRFSVGIMEDLIDETFQNHMIELEKDDIIYLFSDGYPDQFGGEEGKKFKYRRFRHLLLNIHTMPFSEQAKLLEHSIVQWMGNLEQVDDILIIGVKPGLERK
ncbi:MAG: two-component regulator propeller domain-containing protein [Bacteroidales bacterium]